jgi:molybdopterin converting factor small subunit
VAGKTGGPIGEAECDLAPTSVQHLFALLSARHAALARHLEAGVAVAIDGQIYRDALLEPIAPDSEVFILPQIAGG